VILRALLLPCLLLASCGEEPARGSEPIELQVLVAWTADREDGLRVAAEPLHEEALGSLTGWSEERLLRRELGLDGDGLMRLHLMGDRTALAGSGELEAADGARYRGLGAPPEGLSPRARSLWLVLGESGAYEDLEAAGRRSFLLRGPAGAGPSPDQALMVWTRDGQRLELQRRSWTGKQRQEYLDPAPPRSADPVEPEAGAETAGLPPGHPPVTPEDEQPEVGGDG